jgi:hypothetical protein
MIAYFISPHGFGHAARASAVMEAVGEIDSAIQFAIYTTVPEWFFKDSLQVTFHFESVLADIGLVQDTPFQEDLGKTLQCLDNFFPLDRSTVTQLSKKVKKQLCRLIVCDISPLGIVVAKQAGIPSLLVENFTWDWIYEGYLEKEPKLKRHKNYLSDLYAAADFHIQTEPVCRRHPCNLVSNPVSRRFRTSKDLIRKRLGISFSSKVVLITLGGIPEKHDFLGVLKPFEDTIFIVPGASTGAYREANVLRLPFRSDFFHPDLVKAADAVIGKAGYSTISEAYYSGLPFGYISRPQFRETEILAKFIKEQMAGIEIAESEFRSGSWIHCIETLLSLPCGQPENTNGSEQIARFICELFRSLP